MKIDKRPVKQKLITNTKYNFFSTLLIYISGFLIIPLQIKYLGFKYYSLLVLTNMIFSYLQLFDLGLESTVKKHLAEVSIRKEKQSLNQYLSNAIIISLTITLLALISIFLLFHTSETLGFRIENELVGDFAKMLSFSFLFIPFYSLFKFSEYSLKALQRDDLVFKTNLPIYSIYIFGSFLLLIKTKNLIGFFVFQKTIFLLGLIIEFFLLKNLVKLKLSLRLLSRQVTKKILKFALNIQLIKIATFINEQTDKLFISYFLQSYLIGFYQIGVKIIVAVKTLPLVLISALIPATSELSSRGEKEKILKLYLFLNKCMVFTVFPLFFFTAIFADKLIFLWLQEDFPLSYQIIWIFVPAFLINSLTFVGTNLATGIGIPQIQAKAGFLQMIANPILTFIFIRKFGYLGAAVATLITFSSTSFYFLLKLHKRLKLSNFLFLKLTTFSPFFSSFLSSVLTSFFRFLMKTSNRVNTFLFLAGTFFIFSLTYLLLIRLSNFFKSEDKEKFLFIKKALKSF